MKLPTSKQESEWQNDQNRARAGVRMFAFVAQAQSPNPYALWLDRGKVMEPGKWTPDEQKQVKALIQRAGGSRRLKVRHCFSNAQTLLLCDWEHRFEYCEGWWATNEPMLATTHAWLTLNGKVLDVTADDLRKKYPEREDIHYFGLQVPRELVEGYMLRHKVHDMVMEDGKVAAQVFGLPLRNRRVRV